MKNTQLKLKFATEGLPPTSRKQVGSNWSIQQLLLLKHLFKWKKDGKDLHDGSKYRGTKTKDVEKSDKGHYKCLVM